MLRRRTFLALILVSSLLTASCGEIAKTLGDLMVVQSELAEKFGEEVTVNVNPGHQSLIFMVMFINSALNEQAAEARLKRAAEAAQVVKSTYSRIQSVGEIWVGFVRTKTRFVMFHRSQVLAMHGFDKNAQPLPGRSGDVEKAPTDIQVSTTYDSKGNETDIAVNGLQLEGEPGGLGLTLLPFFKAPGDVRAGKLAAPKTVALYFASYAEKPRFLEPVPITFAADGKVVFQTKGNFSGNDAQFCHLTVPYSAFRRMIAGKELTIKLGDKKYALTPSQFAAMQKMVEYVTQ